MSKLGRPTICSIDLAKRIAKHIADDGPLDVAAQLEGVSRQRVYEWIAKGQDERNEPYATFADTLGRARAQAAKRVIKEIRNATYLTKDGEEHPDVRSRMWIAERVYGFESRQRMQIEPAHAADDDDDSPEAIEACVTVLRLPARGAG
jgi:hypothetical protein